MKKLLVLSGKGGTGKTTVAGALIRLWGAARFADCDVDAPNLHLMADVPPEVSREDYFGMPRAEIDPDGCIRCGLCETLCRFHAVSRMADDGWAVDPAACEGCALCAAACPAGAISMKPARTGVLVAHRGDGRFFSDARLRMGSGNSGKLVSEVKRRLLDAGDAGRVAVIDGSPGIGCPVIASVSGADRVLVVAEPTLSGLRDMERILLTAGRMGAKCAVCVNKADVNPEIANAVEAACADRGIPFVGRIPFDARAVAAVNAGTDVIQYGGAAADAIRALAERLLELLTGKEAAE